MKKDKSINDDLKFELIKSEVFIINMFFRKKKKFHLKR